MITARMRAVVDGESWDAFAVDKVAYEEALVALAEQLGLPPLSRPPNGSALVGLGREEVVKVMAPHETAHIATERSCLEGLYGRLPVATPELLDAGVWEGWPWVRMRRLPGVSLEVAWPSLPRSAQLGLARQLGELLAVLHGLEAPPAVERVDWPSWCEERLGTLEATQRRRGCPEELLEGLQAFVEAADLKARRMGWLHTEVMRQHLLVEEGSSGWRLSGLFDFEPSCVGPTHYEYASVGLFVSCGDAEVLHEVLRGANEQVSAERLFALACMHRYANLGWYHRRLGGPLEPAALAERWFGSDPG